ncbi:MAG: hypothetical protein K2O59_01640 [Lachnospiraceae bacterium]|nr:hypothetical protein [Lachnospiraceae bacterium]MDE7176493.1 hypothetical protein [Lachnospiraceae bacterium]
MGNFREKTTKNNQEEVVAAPLLSNLIKVLHVYTKKQLLELREAVDEKIREKEEK